jgi:hypothetical protein
MNPVLFGLAVEWVRLQASIREQGCEYTTQQQARHRYLQERMSMWEWYAVKAAKEAALASIQSQGET